MDVVAYTTVQVSGYLGLLNWEMQPNLLYFYIKVISEMFGLLLIGGLSFAMARQQALTRLRLREEQKKSKLMQQMHTNVLNELPMAIFLMRDQEIIPQNQNAID